MPSDGLKEIQQNLNSLETLYTSTVVALATNQSVETVRAATNRGELVCVSTKSRGERNKRYKRLYEAEAVALYLDKPVSEVRHYLNMARLVVLVKDRGVANHQRYADGYYRNYYRLRSPQVSVD